MSAPIIPSGQDAGVDGGALGGVDGEPACPYGSP